MSMLSQERYNIFLLEETLWLLTKSVGVGIYDFDFERFFKCQHKWQLPSSLTAIARIGAADNYVELYESLQAEGIQLIHTPEQHFLCSELPHWYPLISDLTPKSIWFEDIPNLEDIQSEFEFPIFVKGSRQTSQHNKSLSVIENPQAFEVAMKHYAKDPILNWQNIVVREYIELQAVHGGQADKIPAAFEFRTFWWKGQFVGAGSYWFQADKYTWTKQQKQEALAIAQKVANRVKVPFLVVDVALKQDGEWIVIECNDAQESGYAGLSPIKLWKNILAIESNN